MPTPIKTTNPANQCDREDLQFSFDASVEMLTGPIPPRSNPKSFSQELAEQKYRAAVDACRAALELLENAEVMTDKGPLLVESDDAHDVMTQLSSVLGRSA